MMSDITHIGIILVEPLWNQALGKSNHRLKQLTFIAIANITKEQHGVSVRQHYKIAISWLVVGVLCPCNI